MLACESQSDKEQFQDRQDNAWIFFQVNNKVTRMVSTIRAAVFIANFEQITHCFDVSIPDFEQINAT